MDDISIIMQTTNLTCEKYSYEVKIYVGSIYDNNLHQATARFLPIKMY